MDWKSVWKRCFRAFSFYEAKTFFVKTHVYKIPCYLTMVCAIIIWLNSKNFF